MFFPSLGVVSRIDRLAVAPKWTLQTEQFHKKPRSVLNNQTMAMAYDDLAESQRSQIVPWIQGQVACRE
jgi:hypothetical protein